MSMEHYVSDVIDACCAASLGATTASAGGAEDDDAPAAAEYGDLLDAKWLEREAEAPERDDELVDVGLTLDLDERDDAEENGYVVDLDVGTLLTSLLPGGASDLESAEQELGDGALALGALHEVLLPEQRALRELSDDEEIGDDERFPAFEDAAVVPERPDVEDDGSEGVG